MSALLANLADSLTSVKLCTAFYLSMLLSNAGPYRTTTMTVMDGKALWSGQ